MAETYQQYFIPSDLHPSILKNLPSKSLIKFLTVSKSWYSLIKSPNFIALHFNHHKSLFYNHNNHRLLLLKTSADFSLFRYDNPVGRRRTRLHRPPNDFNSIAASCHNLICLSNENDDRLLLWNPLINRFKEIKYSLLFKISGYTVGLGCISLEHHNDCKIVMISYGNTSIWDEVENPPYAQMYSINNESVGWKSISLPAVDDRLSRISRACLMNDFIHWIVFRFNYESLEVGGLGMIENAVSILRFDLRNDTFDDIQLPTPLQDIIDPCLDLVVIDNSIAVINHIGGEQIVWKMGNYDAEEECWKQLYRIKLNYAANPKKVWMKKDGKVFTTTALGELIMFNVNTQNSGFCEGHVGTTGGKAFGFVESLALLDD